MTHTGRPTGRFDDRTARERILDNCELGASLHGWDCDEETVDVWLSRALPERAALRAALVEAVSLAERLWCEAYEWGRSSPEDSDKIDELRRIAGGRVGE